MQHNNSVSHVTAEFDNDCYYDVILFTADLAPKNDFSLMYNNGKVNFENLSRECVTYFLNRFKNFDITPSRLVGFHNHSFTIELSSKDIYENFSSQIRSERPINRCTNITLRNLSCLQFMVEAFSGIEYCCVMNAGYLELCGIRSEYLSTIVDKMRQYSLTPQKINFFSHSNFHILLDSDEILRIMNSNLQAVTIGEDGPETVESSESMVNNDDDVRHTAESYQSPLIIKSCKSRASYDVRKSNRKSVKAGRYADDQMEEERIRRRNNKSKATKSLDFDKPKIKKVKQSHKAIINDDKENDVLNKEGGQKPLCPMMNTDMDSPVNNNNISFTALAQNQQDFIHETIESIIKQDAVLSDEIPFKPFIKQEATLSESDRQLISPDTEPMYDYTPPKKSVSN